MRALCQHGSVLRRTSIVVVVPFVAILGGCSQAQDAATEVASGARNAVAEEVQGQICAPLQDGQISAQDKQVLSGLVAAARSAGVPAEFTTPLEQIANSGDQPPAESVTALREACA